MALAGGAAQPHATLFLESEGGGLDVARAHAMATVVIHIFPHGAAGPQDADIIGTITLNWP